MPKPRDEAHRRVLASLDTMPDEEDAAINAAIAADPEAAPELDDAWFAKARRGGRPSPTPTK